MVGLAREVAAVTGARVRFPETDPIESGPPIGERLAVDVEEPGLCPRFVGRWVSGVTIGPSPDTIQMRLMAAGQRPVTPSTTSSARDLQSTRYAASATAEAERRKFESVLRLFRKYGDQYDVDSLLMAAQGYQESQLDQSVRSPVGAIGIMQIMPATAADLKVGDVHQPEANIHGGVKYIKQLMTTYVADDNMTKMDRMLFAFASYNAGPARIRAAAAGGRAARPQSEHLVRAGRAGGVGANRPRNGDLRQQHLQVLRRLQAGRGAARGAGSGSGLASPRRRSSREPSRPPEGPWSNWRRIFTFFFVTLGPLKVIASFVFWTREVDLARAREIALGAFGLARSGSSSSDSSAATCC